MSICDIDITAQLCKFYLRHRRNKESNKIMLDFLTIRLNLIVNSGQTGRLGHGEGVLIGFMPVNNVTCHIVTSRVM